MQRTLTVQVADRRWKLTVHSRRAHVTRIVTVSSRRLRIRLQVTGGSVSLLRVAAKKRPQPSAPVSPPAPAPASSPVEAPAPTQAPAAPQIQLPSITLNVSTTPPAIVEPAFSRLVWADEFDGKRGSAPDPARWTHDVGGHGWGNAELQSYTASTSNASLDGSGNLQITARRERVVGADGFTRDWSSSRLTTKGRAAFAQGRLEIRAKMATGQGFVSQLWMMGDNVWDVGWPLCGEIDLTEILGSDTNTTYGTLHGPMADGTTPYATGHGKQLGVPADQAFHVFGVSWNADKVTWSVDGVPYAQETRASLPAGAQWAYAHPLYLLLDLAVGGTFAGTPTQATPSSANLVIDWVRVYG
ncbi:glycoside hydrolase family 16 protein [Paraconexibacter sp. AEG42_29]|uniref:glycoside hydrolase family 16 protein n=1 Tax=Paraconexibacter sp. AEG42_29 TaxID=2997339 RepID=UPI00339D741E